MDQPAAQAEYPLVIHSCAPINYLFITRYVKEGTWGALEAEPFAFFADDAAGLSAVSPTEDLPLRVVGVPADSAALSATDFRFRPPAFAEGPAAPSSVPAASSSLIPPITSSFPAEVGSTG